MRAVNLLPRETKQRGFSVPSVPALVAVCAGVVVLAGLGGDYMLESGKVAKEKHALADVQAQVAALPPAPAGPSAEETQLAGVHSARVSALSGAMGTRVSWDRILREFSLVLPDDVWLTSLDAQSPISPASTDSASTTVPGSPSQFKIDGYTYSHDGVARLLARLQLIPDLEDVQLLQSTEANVDGQDVVEFQLAANIRPAKPTGSPSS
ncbi:MAG TPA: PilN domain-containing protein [Gaiellaceae bacterium]|nr:PilN domain-containing protein [Gaiellaceae bacterium]